MKKILIVSHAMEIGGVERSLLGLLENIDYEKFEVDLFLFRHQGELLDFIPNKVNLLPEKKEYACLAVPMINVLKDRKFCIAIGRIFAKYYAKYKLKRVDSSKDNAIGIEYSHKYTKRFMPEISNVKYDAAISFLTPHYFVIEKVQAKKKIAWIHTDYSKLIIDVKSELKMWGKYDYIVSISDSVSKKFLSIFPELNEKIVLIHNMMATNFIKKQSNEFTVENEMGNSDNIKLLSIGRFCYAKNFDNIPDICRRIRSLNVNVEWYIIGFGSDEDLIRKKIIECGMEDYVKILGKKINPYPYIKECDYYIQPSRYEGNAVTVHEAQFLNKFPIITKYPTSSSQITNEIDGAIVEMSNEDCATGIVKVINNKEMQKKVHLNLQKVNHCHEDLMRFYKIIV